MRDIQYPKQGLLDWYMRMKLIRSVLKRLLRRGFSVRCLLVKMRYYKVIDFCVNFSSFNQNFSIIWYNKMVYIYIFTWYIFSLSNKYLTNSGQKKCFVPPTGQMALNAKYLWFCSSLRPALSNRLLLKCIVYENIWTKHKILMNYFYYYKNDIIAN